MRATFAGLTHAIRNLMMAVFAIICHPYFLRTASNGAPLGLYCPFKALKGDRRAAVSFLKREAPFFTANLTLMHSKEGRNQKRLSYENRFNNHMIFDLKII